MPRFSSPVTTLAGLAIVGIIATGCAGTGVAAAPAAASVAAAARPSLDLKITGGLAPGSYVADPSASLNYCSHTKDGTWRVLYAGGKPWLAVDLLVGPHAADAGRAGDLALEISAGPAYLWIDQPKFRGGDAPGRSKATVALRADGAGMAFDVTATTPNRTPDGDGVSTDVALTVVCPG
jgi:hypothetical protein